MTNGRFSPHLAPVLILLWFAQPGSARAAEPPPGPGIGLVEVIRMMLDHDPNVSIGESRLRSSQGALLSSRGIFDPVVNAGLTERELNDPLSEVASREQSILTNSLGMTKLFRTGLSIEPELQLSRTADTGRQDVNLGTFSFTLRQPLLRGRGREFTAAPELSAELQVAASVLDLRQTTSERALAVVAQYWEARAAVLNLAILQESEDRARELMETTRKLIEADVTPAADLVQVEANVVSKETARIGGERDLFAARQALGREIGLEPARIAALPLPSDPFPTLPAAAALPGGDVSRWIAVAVERRSDLQAARERQSAAEVLRKAADQALQPQLDLLFTPSYSGLVEGSDADSFLGPLYRNIPGAASLLSLSLSWPTQNSRARGDLAQIEAVREQNELLEELITRQIGANVPIAVDAVVRGAQQLERAQEAVRLFERAVENEEKKLRAGTSTLIDVISQRDRLTSARQSQVASHFALAVAIAQLRFETGTLLPGDVRGVQALHLTTLPFQAGDEP
ncbi:MAG TPA: TolC family protein [Thermoanaerobaculia bacterium]